MTKREQKLQNKNLKKVRLFKIHFDKYVNKQYKRIIL